MARKRTFKNVFVKQARGGRQNLFGAMPCKEEEGEGQLTNEARGGKPSLFGAMPCKEEEGRRPTDERIKRGETEPVSGLCHARSKKAKPR